MTKKQADNFLRVLHETYFNLFTEFMVKGPFIPDFKGYFIIRPEHDNKLLVKGPSTRVKLLVKSEMLL